MRAEDYVGFLWDGKGVAHGVFLGGNKHGCESPLLDQRGATISAARPGTQHVLSLAIGHSAEFHAVRADCFECNLLVFGEEWGVGGEYWLCCFHF